MNDSPAIKFHSQLPPPPRSQEKHSTRTFIWLQPGGRHCYVGVVAFLVTLVLSFGLFSARGEPPSTTPEPRPTPGLAPAPVAAKDPSNILWLDDAVIRKARQAVVMLQSDDAAKGSWSGFFASADGLVVTSASPLEGLRRVVIRTHDKKEIQGARVMAIDPLTDLAVLATGTQKTPVYLSVPDKPVAAGEPCVAINHMEAGIFKTADGMLLARRKGMDWSETRCMELWSVAVSPNMKGLTGAPVITRDGRVAGMCDFIGGSQRQRFNYAIPEAAIVAVLARARAARKPLEFPKPGEISGSCEPAVIGDPDFMEAMALASAGNRAAAIEKYRAVLKRHPQNPLVMNRLASCLASTGNLDEARKILEEAIRLAPERLGLQLMYGIILQAQGNSVKMIRHYQDLTTRFPMLGDAWGRLGKCLFQADRQAEGLAAISKWTELEPDSMAAWDAYPLAQFNLCVCYAKGQGVAQDEVEAYKWLLLAAAQGFELAKKTVLLMETSGRRSGHNHEIKPKA